MRLIELAGETYGRLTVLDRAENDPRGRAQWRCECQCGEIKTIPARHLRGGLIRSCGCLQAENRRLTHGRRKSAPTYLAVHKRLARTKGKASERTCYVCGDPAAHWSYDHLDTDERHQRIKNSLVAYSEDLEHYQPLCLTCHRRRDGW